MPVSEKRQRSGERIFLAMFRLFPYLFFSKSLWLLAPLLILGMCQLGLATLTNIPSQRDLSIPEGAVVYSLLAVTQGESPYRDYRAPPYCTTPYTPLYYYLVGLFVRGLSFSEQVSALYGCGRVLTFFCCLASIFFVMRLAQLLGASTIHALTGALLVTTSSCLYPWSYTCRPDCLALFWTLAGLAFFLPQLSVRRALGASLLFLAAFASKQSYVIAPLVGTIICWRCHQKKTAFVLMGSFCLGVGILILVMQLISHEWFLANVLVANLAPVNGLQIPVLVFLGYIWGAIALWPWGLFLLMRWRRHRSQSQAVLTAYAVFSLVWSIFLSAKAGADQNYFLEPVFAWAIMAGRGLQRAEAWTRCRTGWRWTCALLLLLLILGTIHHFLHLRLDWLEEKDDNGSTLQQLEAIPGDILFSDAGLALRSGRKLWLLDKFNAAYLGEKGIITFSELLARLNQGTIAAVVLEHPSPWATVWGFPWWPPTVARAIQTHYVYVGRIEDYYLFLPRKRQTFARPKEKQ
jgi:hypothetical protein